MQLDLTEEQLRMLDELVQSRIANLGTEIRHSDRPDYRQALVQQREQLRGLSAQLRDVSASSAEGL